MGIFLKHLISGNHLLQKLLDMCGHELVIIKRYALTLYAMGGTKCPDRFLFAIAYFFFIDPMTSNFFTFPKYVLTLL